MTVAPIDYSDDIFDSLGLCGTFGELVVRWHACTSCDLCKERGGLGKVVLGTRYVQQPNGGFQPIMDPTGARVLAVGHWPQKGEEKTGFAFSGTEGIKARNHLGKYSRRTRRYTGIQPDDVYWTNMLGCPVSRRVPSKAMSSCGKRVRALVRIINPKMIIMLGESPTRNLTGSPYKLDQMRRMVHHYMGIPMVVVLDFWSLSAVERLGEEQSVDLKRREARNDVKFAVGVYREEVLDG